MLSLDAFLTPLPLPAAAVGQEGNRHAPAKPAQPPPESLPGPPPGLKLKWGKAVQHLPPLPVAPRLETGSIPWECPQPLLAGGQRQDQAHQVLPLARAAMEPVLATRRSKA